MVKVQGNFSSGEIAVEIDGPQNNNIVNFVPFQSHLRGRWDPTRVRIAAGDDLRPDTLPVIPGMVICVDLKRKQLRSVDPLSFPENEQLLRDLSPLWSQLSGFRVEVEPHKEIRVGNQNPTEMKTVLWELWKLIDSKLARCLTDNMPPWSVILAMEGNVLRGTGKIMDWDDTATRKRGRFLEDDEILAVRERLETRERVATAVCE